MSTEGRIDVGLSPGQEAAEANIVFEQSKRALHLDGTAKTQMDSTFGHNVSGASSRFSQKVFLRTISLGLSGTLARQHCVRCGHLGPAALCPVWAPTTIFTPVPGGGHKLSVLYFCGLPPQVQLPALYTGKTVFFWVIFHVLDAAHLLAKLACLLLVIVGGLYEAHLAILLQV